MIPRHADSVSAIVYWDPDSKLGQFFHHLKELTIRMDIPIYKRLRGLTPEESGSLFKDYRFLALGRNMASLARLLLQSTSPLDSCRIEIDLGDSEDKDLKNLSHAADAEYLIILYRFMFNDCAWSQFPERTVIVWRRPKQLHHTSSIGAEELLRSLPSSLKFPIGVEEGLNVTEIASAEKWIDEGLSTRKLVVEWDPY